MSHELVICLIAVAVNLAGMMAIYFVMSHVIVGLVWRRSSIPGVLALIVIAQLFWIAPAFLIEAKGAGRAGSYALWLGNWLVCGFSLVLFLKSAAHIPVALHDASRMDGLGSLATWRHATLPFVRRDLIIVAVFTIMATLLPFWGVINLPDGNVITIFERTSSFAEHVTRMAAGSLLGAIPLIAIFFAARKTA
jgi:ABC-type sugar transport system permease subunit